MSMKPAVVKRGGMRPMPPPIIAPKDKTPAAPAVRHYEAGELRAVFKGCDRNGDGVLDRNELREAFRRLGSSLSIVRAYLGMHHADANGDGVISDTELVQLVKYAQKIGYTFHAYI